jgi:hypothetical protein
MNLMKHFGDGFDKLRGNISVPLFINVVNFGVGCGKGK